MHAVFEDLKQLSDVLLREVEVDVTNVAPGTTRMGVMRVPGVMRVMRVSAVSVMGVSVVRVECDESECSECLRVSV